MTRSTENPQDYDDRLADFANQALSRQIENIESGVDDELSGLEDTVLRLTRAMPHDPVPQSTLNRLKSDFAVRRQILHKAQNEKSPFMAFLDRMMRMEINPNIILTVGSMAVLAGIFMAVSFSSGQPSNTLTGTAGASSQIPGITIIIGGAFVLILLWINRRK
jgi:hypothetical protein